MKIENTTHLVLVGPTLIGTASDAAKAREIRDEYARKNGFKVFPTIAEVDHWKELVEREVAPAKTLKQISSPVKRSPKITDEQSRLIYTKWIELGKPTMSNLANALPFSISQTAIQRHISKHREQ